MTRLSGEALLFVSAASCLIWEPGEPHWWPRRPAPRVPVPWSAAMPRDGAGATSGSPDTRLPAWMLQRFAKALTGEDSGASARGGRPSVDGRGKQRPDAKRRRCNWCETRCRSAPGEGAGRSVRAGSCTVWRVGKRDRRIALGGCREQDGGRSGGVLFATGPAGGNGTDGMATAMDRAGWGWRGGYDRVGRSVGVSRTVGRW